jgi:hypothetical protein
MQILPAESAEIGGFLRELAEAKLIVIYTVDDKQYFQVVNFEKHQKVDRRYPSKLPPPPDEVEASPPNPAECRPRNGMEWNGTRREGKGRESSTVVDNGRARAKVETSEKARFSFSKTMHRGGSPASQTGPPNGPSQDVEKPPQTGPPEQFLEPDPLGNLVEVGIERDPGGNPVK